MVNDDDNKSASIVACAIICQVLSGIFVAARFYSRGFITRTLGREDYCILTAWRSWWSTLFYQISLAFSKISILFLYIRIFVAYTYARRAGFVILAIVIIYNTLGFISTMTICIPLHAYWDFSVSGKCHPISFMWAAIVLHITTDFMIFVLPIPVVYRMTLPMGQKIGLLVVFALGFFVCLISILRAVWIYELLDSPDVTWDFVAIVNWNAIEINTSILVPCLIVLKPLIVKVYPALATPHPSYDPTGAPPTIGSDPTDLNRGQRDVYRTTVQSEKSSVRRADERMDAGAGQASLNGTWRFFGYISILMKFRKDYPEDVHFGIIMSWLVNNCKQWIPDLDDIPPVLFLDIRPVFPNIMMMVFDCNSSAQFTQVRSVPKHPITRTLLEMRLNSCDHLQQSSLMSDMHGRGIHQHDSARDI